MQVKKQEIKHPFAYLRQLREGKDFLLRVSAGAYTSNKNKTFVQLYTRTGKYLNAKNLKKFYTEDMLEEAKLFVEPCSLRCSGVRTNYFTRGKKGAQGSSRYYPENLTAPQMCKDSLRALVNEAIRDNITDETRICIIGKLDTMDNINIQNTLYGCIFYIQEHIFSRQHISWSKETMQLIVKELEDNIFPRTRHFQE